jgi:hypothetical protein
MPTTRCRRPTPQLSILTALILSSSAAAQTVLGGNVFNTGSTSPLTANGVYLVASHVTVPNGTALTVPPGVIFKMYPGTTFTVQGTLIALGSSPQPIVFTSYRDDMFGGDTNNDGGATYPADGDWAYAYFGPSSDASSLTSTYFRFAGASTGYGPQPSVYFDGSNATWNVGTVENALAACATLQANSFPTISGVSFVGGTVAVDNVPLGALAGFTSCGASGNSVYDAHRVTAANVAAPIGVAASNSLNGVGTFVLATNLSVNATLTLGAGVVFKFEGSRTADVYQTLDVNGTAGSPVVFTSIKDDAFGGDTNQNGAANAGAPADWAYLAFQPNSDASTVDHLHVRFAGASTGYGPQPAVYAVSSNCALNGLVVQSVAGPCLDLQNNSYPTVQGCSFNGGTIAVDNAQLAALAGFSGCSAAGNSVYDAIRVTTATIGGAATVEVDDTLNGNGVFVVATNVVVQNGGTLTLDAGVTAKFEGSRTFDVHGLLLTNGGAGSPVTLTTTTDDAVGGDTNKNGAANVPTPASWAYLALQPTSDASVLNGLHVRYAGASTGYGNQPSVYLVSSNCTLSGCVVKHGGAAGLDLQTNSYPTVVGTAFENCTVAVQSAQLAALAGFSGCTASGNSVLNAIRVTAAHVTAPASVVAANSLNNDGAFVLATNLTVNAPLTLGAGVVVKFEGSRTADFYQPLFANGVDGAPVVFTTLADDAYGGDTDLDGAATPPVKGAWAYVNFQAGSTPGALSYCRVRYAGASTGYGPQPSAYVVGSPTFAHCAFEHCAAACADLQAVGEPAMSFCAFDDGSVPLVGVRPTAVPKLVRCTAAGNASRQALRLAATTVAGGQNLTWRKINTLNGDGALLLAVGPQRQRGRDADARSRGRAEGGRQRIRSTPTARSSPPAPARSPSSSRRSPTTPSAAIRTRTPPRRRPRRGRGPTCMRSPGRRRSSSTRASASPAAARATGTSRRSTPPPRRRSGVPCASSTDRTPASISPPRRARATTSSRSRTRSTACARPRPP